MTWLCILVYSVVYTVGLLLTCTTHTQYTTNNFPVQTYEQLHVQEKSPETYLARFALQGIFPGPYSSCMKIVGILKTCKKCNVPFDSENHEIFFVLVMYVKCYMSGQGNYLWFNMCALEEFVVALYCSLCGRIKVYSSIQYQLGAKLYCMYSSAHNWEIQCTWANTTSIFKNC